jgi:hypothetical protein
MSVEVIALREQGAPDLPPDWRGDARVGQIELGRTQGCLRDLNLGGSNIESGAGFVESGLASWRSSSSCWRARVRSASSRAASARETWARAEATAAWYWSGSISNRGSPACTVSPASKAAICRKHSGTNVDGFDRLDAGVELGQVAHLLHLDPLDGDRGRGRLSCAGLLGDSSAVEGEQRGNHEQAGNT